MQKKLIALAVAAAFSAPAFADVTVYGVVDAAVARLSQSGQKTDTLAVSGGLASSRIGVTGAEDLNNGMKAVIKLEYGLDTETSDGIGAARQEMLAVAGDFGTVATGYLQTTGYDYGSKFDPTAGSTVSPLQNMTAGHFNFLIGSKATASRAPRALAYISPNIAGFTVALNYTTSLQTTLSVPGLTTQPSLGTNLGNLTVASSAANTKSTATLISVNYENGPLAAAVVRATTSGTAPMIVTGTGAATVVTGGFDVNYTATALGASYDLGMVKLFGTYQTASNSAPGSYTDKLYNVSAVAPVGPGAVAVSYAKAKIGSAAGLNENGSSYTVAYLQGLSKTTTAYAAFSKATNGSDTNAFSVNNSALGGTATTLSPSSNMLAVGLNKKF